MTKLRLYDVLKASYGSPEKQKQTLSRYGYVRDDVLSNHNEQVYYNPREHKLIFSVTGTHNLADWTTDVALAVGRIKHTTRYKHAHEWLRYAKKKYHPTETVVVGHSLGGTIAGFISSADDKVYTLDRGHVGQRERHGQKHFRDKQDIVSLFDTKAFVVKGASQYTSHDVRNIEHAPIFV